MPTLSLHNRSFRRPVPAGHARRLAPRLAAGALALSAPLACADIHIGVILSRTGAGAWRGMPEEHALKLWPAEMAGEKLRLTVLSDATDPTTAAKNAQRLASED